MVSSARRSAILSVYRDYGNDPVFNRLREHGPRKHVVIGRGSLRPVVVFVGEAPGEMEAHTGRPFMGEAGRVLDRLLRDVGLTRREVFITNVVKYRPTIGTLSIRNRTPSPDEIAASRPYLIRELDVLRAPVVLMGATPLRAVLERRERVGDWSGRGFYDADHIYGVCYHPAVAVYEPDMYATVRRDFRMVLTGINVVRR